MRERLLYPLYKGTERSIPTFGSCRAHTPSRGRCPAAGDCSASVWSNDLQHNRSGASAPAELCSLHCGCMAATGPGPAGYPVVYQPRASTQIWPDFGRVSSISVFALFGRASQACGLRSPRLWPRGHLRIQKQPRRARNQHLTPAVE